MNIELNRLQTFSDWPGDAPVSPYRIAKAGFFATKQGYEVECFSCHIKISTWNYGDQAMAKHKDLSPTCPFVLDPSTSGNAPFTSTPSIVALTPLDYRNESVRLASFENWPVPNIVTPEDLARAGFYSLKDGDNTKCAYCNGVVRAWESEDIPDLEHKRHFPACWFVQNVINRRLANSSLNSVTHSEGPLIQVRSEVDNLNELGVQKHNGPKRPDYATVESRLRSFTNWSPSLIQTPDQLSQAGFYYEGVGDQVRCFHCDGGLRHWDPEDDPWTEHARWFSTCSFVKLVKGQEFVTACSLSNVGQINLPKEKIQSSRKRREVTERELEEHLVSPAAIAALTIGIDVQRVKRALKEKLQLTGQGYSHPDALVEAALNLQLEEDDGFENTRTRDAVTAAISEVVRAARAQTSSSSSSPSDPDKNLTSPLSLEEENRRLREARQCKICMDAEVGIVFLPCGHLATCVTCAPNLEDCPVCRSTIKATVRTFLS